MPTPAGPTGGCQPDGGSEIVDGVAGQVMSVRSGAPKLAPEWFAERSTVRIDDGAGLEFDVSAADGDVPALVVHLVAVC